MLEGAAAPQIEEIRPARELFKRRTTLGKPQGKVGGEGLVKDDGPAGRCGFDPVGANCSSPFAARRILLAGQSHLHRTARELGVFPQVQRGRHLPCKLC